MFPDPSTVRIVHDTMIAEELARQAPDHRVPDRATTIQVPGIRRGTARALVRLAARIAPAHDSEPAAA